MLNSKELPQETQKELETLRHMQLADLNEDQLAFLKARRDYLSVDECRAFGINLNEAVEPESESPEAPAQQVPTPKRKK